MDIAGLVVGIKRARISKADDFSPLPTIRFGTKIINRKTNEIGLLIKTWLNEYADGKVWFATCVDKNGKRYHIELDEIAPIEEDEE